MKNVLSICFLIGYVSLSYSQIYDLENDNAIYLYEPLTDEFNLGTTYDNTKWTWTPGYSEHNGSSCLQDDHNNISVQSGYLRLSVQKESSACSDIWGETFNEEFTSGNLFGLNETQYGYFEVRFKITPIPSAPYTQDGFSANAWLWRSWVPYNGIWSEIDLAEIDASDHRHTCNVIYDPNEDDDIPSQQNIRCPVGSPDPCSPPDLILTEGWHTYTAVWHPNTIILYVDGAEINRGYIGTPGMEPMNWILSTSTGEYQFDTEIGEYTSFPFHMDVDYVRVYKLLMDCETVINTCSFYFGGHDDKVKKSITIGCDGSSNIQPIGSSTYLRATDFVEIYGNFEVPLGAELTIETIGTCY